MKESGIREIALRASALSLEGRRALLDMIKTIQDLEQKKRDS